jgi:hypothetical protein
MKYLIILLFIGSLACNTTDVGPAFVIDYPGQAAGDTLDGRLLLLLSNDDSSEPRFQISDGANTQIVFGMDVEGWHPGEQIVMNSTTAYGYPVESMNDLPDGEYNVQVLLHVYETFERSDGQVVKMPDKPDHHTTR